MDIIDKSIYKSGLFGKRKNQALTNRGMSATLSVMKDFTRINSAALHENAADLIGRQWMLVTAGNTAHKRSWNTMTASWGGLGHLWNKDVAFVFVRPQRHTFEFTEKDTNLTLSFFGEEYRKALQFCGTKSGRDSDKAEQTGLTPFETPCGSVAFKEARIILECEKLYAEFLNEKSFVRKDVVEECYPGRDFHRMYVCEILDAWVKD